MALTEQIRSDYDALLAESAGARFVQFDAVIRLDETRGANKRPPGGVLPAASRTGLRDRPFRCRTYSSASFASFAGSTTRVRLPTTPLADAVPPPLVLISSTIWACSSISYVPDPMFNRIQLNA